MTSLAERWGLTVDVPLLRKAVEWVEEQDQLDQAKRQWMQDIVILPEHQRVKYNKHEVGCGTAYCVAGYIAQLVDERFQTTAQVVPARLSGDALDVAHEALGLVNEYGALMNNGLFYATNTAADVRRRAEEIVGEPL